MRSMGFMATKKKAKRTVKPGTTGSKRRVSGRTPANTRKAHPVPQAPSAPAEQPAFGVPPPRTYFGSTAGGLRPALTVQQPSQAGGVNPSPPTSSPSAPLVRAPVQDRATWRDIISQVDWLEIVRLAAIPVGSVLLLLGGYYAGTFAVRAALPPKPEDGTVILQDSPLKLSDFASCAAKGFPIEDDGQHRRCYAPDGQVRVQEVPSMAELHVTDPRLVLVSPVQGEVVGTILTLHGYARLYEHPIHVQLFHDGQVVAESEVSPDVPKNGDYGSFTMSFELPQDGPDEFMAELQGIRDEDASPLRPVKVTVIRRVR